MSRAAVEIERHGAAVVPRLEELWLALKDHHGACTPGEPVRDDATSWRMRQDDYAQWLGEEGAFVLVARRGEQLVGYAIVRAQAAGPTWPEPRRCAIVQDIAVAAQARGAGVGRALLERVRSETGCNVVELEVLSANRSAVAFYERLGFARRVERLRWGGPVS